jgi:hypothetical protein
MKQSRLMVLALVLLAGMALIVAAQLTNQDRPEPNAPPQRPARAAAAAATGPARKPYAQMTPEERLEAREAQRRNIAARAAERAVETPPTDEERQKLQPLLVNEQRVDATLTAALAQPGQWKVIPGELAIRQEANGMLWYYGKRAEPKMASEYDFLAQVEKLAQHPAQPTLRGGRLLLIDRAGRYWVSGDAYPDLLRCYDPSSGKWTENRLTSQMMLAAGHVNVLRNPNGRWVNIALEDAAGNLHFVAIYRDGSQRPIRDSYWIHTRSAAGEWTAFSIDQVAVNDECHFVEQAGGRICLVRQVQSNPFDMPYFDGKAWSLLKAESCLDATHAIRQVVPLPDGSILSTCSDGATWQYWPPGAADSPLEHLDQLIAALDEPDPAARQRAEDSLAALGPQVRQALERENGQASPEARLRLTHLVNKILLHARDTHGVTNLFGQFQARHMEIVGADYRKSVALRAEEVTDLRTDGKTSAPLALIVLDQNRQWRMRAFDGEAWGLRGFESWYLPLAKPDGRGNVWIDGGIGIDADKKLVEPTPGVAPGAAMFTDGGGKVAFSNNVLFDPAAAPATLHDEQHLYSLGMYHQAGARVGWGIDRRAFPHRVLRLSGGDEPAVIDGGPPHAGLVAITPLARGFLAHPSVRSEIAQGYKWGWMWDGQQWTTADNWYDFFSTDPAVLAALAGSGLRMYPTRWNDPFAGGIASDGKAHLWMWQIQSGSTRAQARLRYFDGTQGHEMLADSGMRIDNFVLLDVVDHGTALLAYDRAAKALSLISYQDQLFRRKALLNSDEPVNFKSFSVIHGPTTTWLKTPRGQLVVYRAGAASVVESDVEPLFVDDKDRLWASDHGALVTMLGNQALTAAPGPAAVQQVLQSAGGDILALDSLGVTRYVIDPGGAAPALRAAARQGWETAHNKFDGCFIDETNHIWFAGTLDHVARVTLPENFWK